MQERERRNAEDETERQVREIRIWFFRRLGQASLLDAFQIIIGLILSAVGVYAASIYNGQLNEMRQTNVLTKQALDGSAVTLAQTLSKMQEQIDVMHTQAVAEKRQANAAITTAKTAERSEALSEAEILPHITLQHMELAEPIIAGKPTRVANGFVNAGGSTAYDIHSVSSCGTILGGSLPSYDLTPPTGSQATIGAKGTYDTPMWIDPQTPLQVQQISDGTRKVYVEGQITYGDFRHELHHTNYCAVLDTKTGEFIGCREQKPSD